MGIRPETSRTGLANMRFQLSKNSVQTVDRPDLPSQGQYIAPVAIRMKQRLEQNIVGFRKRLLELRKPMVHTRRDVFCSSQHSRSHAIDLRGVSRLYNLRFRTLPGKRLAPVAQPVELSPNMIA
jgi:hypothetical protein